MAKRTLYKPVMVAVSCQIQGGMMAQSKKLATAFDQYGKEKK